MNYKALAPYLFLTIVIIIGLLSHSGCANVLPPQGGVMDSIPPQLIKSNPANATVNFNTNKISLSFNEFVELNNVQENLLVSPLPKNNPTIDYKLNTVSIKLKDSLEANTTYIINFGNSIKDINEGNILKGFTYVFSTGNYMDSLELKGNVVLAETGKPDTTMIVMLHSSANDSAVVKQKPRYISKLDGKGNFVFKNLPSRKFYLYALKDESGGSLYLDDRNLFAFADAPVTIGASNEKIQLFAYAVKDEPQEKTPQAPTTGTRNRVAGIAADKRLKYQTSLINNQQDLLTDFTINFELPLQSLDTAKIRFYTDSAFTPVANYTFQKDSNNKKITLAYTWNENKLYHIIIDKDFAEDSSGKKLSKIDTLSFTTKKRSDYGLLKLKFRNLDISKNPVLQFVLNQSLYKSYPLTSKDFQQPLFLPAEYELRILFDTNKNGKWDAGEFFNKHLQPEIVKASDRKIIVKANWQNEFEIEL
jgi:hypothetical protein